MDNICNCIACGSRGNCCELVIYPEFICSITGRLMFDPVIAPDGNTYERSVIVENHGVNDDQLVSNKSLKHLIHKIFANSKQIKMVKDKHMEHMTVPYECKCIRCIYVNELNRKKNDDNIKNEYTNLLNLFNNKNVSTTELIEIISKTSDDVINFIDNSLPFTLLIRACENHLNEVALVLIPRMLPTTLLKMPYFGCSNAFIISCDEGLDDVTIALLNTNLYDNELVRGLYGAIKNRSTYIVNMIIVKIKKLHKNVVFFPKNLMEFAKKYNMIEVVKAFESESSKQKIEI